jgi:hypothetical protein
VTFVFDFAADTDLDFGKEVLNLFSEYQLRAAQINVSSLSADAYPASNLLPEVLWAADPTGNLTPLGPSNLLSLAGSKRSCISQERSLTINVAPRFAMGVSVNGGGVFTNLAEAAYNDRVTDLWCYSDTPNAPNYAGLIGCMRNMATAAGTNPVLRWECVVTLACRRPR